jgi:addiction module RelE/StbE family toxin
MWTIKETKRAAKQLDRAPAEIVRAYEFWKAVAQNQGPMGLSAINGFWDHPLKGEWAGSRASSLNRQWRVIYQVNALLITITVIEVNAHEYRKKS